MSWLEQHSLSERYAVEAEAALRKGDADAATSLYGLAATAELAALSEIDVLKIRTLGVTVVSAAALFFKAKDYRKAEVIAHQWLSSDHLPGFASGQLEEILQAIWNEKAISRSGIEFKGTEILISVKGGEVVHGGAPLDIIATKVEQVSAIFYRTAELLLGRPHRTRGGPAEDIREICRPWLFQTVPGSYQFAVRVQGPKQGSLFAHEAVKSEKIAFKFLEIMKASAEDPVGALVETVPDPQYRVTFLKLTRNLAPTGDSFDQLLVKPVLSNASAIVLKSETRAGINEVIRNTRPQATQMERELQFHGILRALHLDEDWLEISVPTENALMRVKVFGAGDAVDDLIGPMVNRRVVLDVLEVRPDRYTFRDIQLAD